MSHVHGKAEKAGQSESGGEIKGTSREAKMEAIKRQRKEPTHKLPWVVGTFWFLVPGSTYSSVNHDCMVCPWLLREILIFKIHYPIFASSSLQP